MGLDILTLEEARRQALHDAPALNVTRPPYNVFPGVTASPEVGIQLAIDQARDNAIAGSGPTKVLIPAGTYTVDLHVIPGQSGTAIAAAAIWGYSDVTIELAPGAVLKLKNSVALPATATEAHIVSVTTPKLRPAAGGTIKSGFRLVGGTVDGNAANQAGIVVNSGVYLGYCRSSTVTGTKVQNVYGTGSGPPTETFGFNIETSRDCQFIGCEADGGGDSHTSTGFAAGHSYGVTWTSCVSHDHGHGHGFTHYECAGVEHAGCRAYSNVASGFNSELSNGVSYAACISGGKSPDTSPDGSVALSWWANNTVLGNDVGWSIQGSTRVTLGDDCQGCFNTSVGVSIYSNTSVTPNVANQDVMVAGIHLYTVAGEAYNLVVADANQLATYGRAKIKHSTDYGDTLTSWAPIFESFAQNGGAGMRFYSRNKNSGGANWAYRFFADYDAAAPFLAATEAGQVATLGRVLARAAKSADYTAARKDHIIAVTSTAAQRTITLPSAAAPGGGAVTYGTGQAFIVKDESGGAAAHPIVIAAAGSDTIDGKASIEIAVNYGYVCLYSTGTGWGVIGGRVADEYEQAGLYAPDRPNSVLALTAQRLTLARFVPKRDMVSAKLAFGVQTAAGSNDSVELATFDSAGTRIAYTGVTAGKLNATGAQAITAAGTHKAGHVYYAALLCATIGGTAASVVARNAQAANGAELFEATPGTLDATTEHLAKTGVTVMPSSLTLFSGGPFVTSTVAVVAVRES